MSLFEPVSGPMNLKFYKVHLYIFFYPLKLEFEIQINFVSIYDVT